MTDGERLAVIEEKIDGLKTQQARFFSHFDSESRAREDLKTRVARLEERADGNRWNFNSIMQLIANLVAAGAVLVMALK